MIIQQEKDFEIAGKTEKGVVIVATLFDDENNKVSQSIALGDVNGDFLITMEGQKGSYNKYRLEISDSNHTHKFYDILFGEVWIFAGEQKDFTRDITYDEEKDCNVRFLRYLEDEYKWLSMDEKNEIYDLIESCAFELQEKLDLPVAIVDATLLSGYADAWLSEKTAALHTNLKKYLIDLNRFSDYASENTNKDELSSMFYTYFDSLSSMNINGVIWSQGTSDFKSVESDKYNSIITTYTYLLNQLFSDLINMFGNDTQIYCVQETYSEDLFVQDLRFAQSIPAYQINNVNIISTYDCFTTQSMEEELVLAEDTSIDEEITNEEEMEEIEYVFSYEKYVERISDSVYYIYYQNDFTYVSPSFSNFIVSNNIITISFNNIYILEEVDEIYGLVILDEEGNSLDYEITFIKNKFKISLNIEEEININDLSYTIYYGYIDDIYKCNLKTTNGLPIVPFKINIIG